MHILVDISSHGFGHYSQTAPIVNLLGENNPKLKITLRTTLAEDFVRAKIHTPISIIPESLDFGMKMNSAIETDVDASEKAYIEFHKDWRYRLDVQKKRIQHLKPDLIFANIPYLSLAAANELGINTIALCSLNWAHIYQGYYHSKDLHHKVFNDMLDAYNSALKYLCPEPSMPMPGLNNKQTIAPIAKLGTNQREELNHLFKLDGNEKIALIVPGGIATEIPIETWPEVPGIRWITTWNHAIQRRDIIRLDDIIQLKDITPHNKMNMSFTDILCSSDVIITKPGYGVIAEAICNQKPVLYVRRHDWPEEQNIVDWLQQNGISQEITKEVFFNGKMVDEIEKIASLKPNEKIEPNGAKEAVEIIEGVLYKNY